MNNNNTGKAGDKLKAVLEKSKQKKRNTFALHDPAHCLAPGLFVSVRKQELKKLQHWTTSYYSEKHKRTVKFEGFQLLGADTMRVLQGIVAIAGGWGEPVSVGEQLELNLLSPEAPVAGKVFRPVAYVAFSSTQLLSTIGQGDSGQNAKHIKECIDKLQNTFVTITEPDPNDPFNTIESRQSLISNRFYSVKDQRWSLCLNYGLVKSVFGIDSEDLRSYVRINLNETKALTLDTASLMHQRICAIVSPGKSHLFNLDTLVSNVYIDNQELSRATASHRKKQVKAGLAQLGQLPGWKVEESTPGTYRITRGAI